MSVNEVEKDVQEAETWEELPRHWQLFVVGTLEDCLASIFQSGQSRCRCHGPGPRLPPSGEAERRARKLAVKALERLANERRETG